MGRITHNEVHLPSCFPCFLINVVITRKEQRALFFLHLPNFDRSEDKI